MLSTAIGRLGWRPADFWAATPHEFAAAMEYQERIAELRRLQAEAARQG